MVVRCRYLQCTKFDLKDNVTGLGLTHLFDLDQFGKVVFGLSSKVCGKVSI